VHQPDRELRQRVDHVTSAGGRSNNEISSRSRRSIQTIPLTRNSDIWNFRLYGTFLPGPKRNKLSYNKISRLYGTNFGYMEWISRSLRSVYKTVEASVEAVDAVGGLVDAVQAAGRVKKDHGGR